MKKVDGPIHMDPCRLMKRLAPFLLLLLLLPMRTAAQDTPISWTVVPGFNGTFKYGSWIPIDITITNIGNDLSGRLEWRWNNSGTRWGQALDLPRGAKKHVILSAVAEAPFGGSATLEYIADNRVVASEKIRYNQVDTNTLLVGILSNTTNALAALSGLHAEAIQAQAGTRTALVRLQPEMVLERSELFQGLDVLVVTGIDTSAWTETQRAALASWVAEGGRLVIGGDQVATSSGFGSLAPATVREPLHEIPISSLAATTHWRPRDPAARIKALTLTPNEGAETTITAADGTPLVVRRNYGSGLILQLAFNPVVLDTQGDPLPLWEDLMPWSGIVAPWQQLRSNGEWMLRNALALPELQLPPIWKLLIFLILYTVIVGPANYLLLRRIDRREWAYFSIPAAALLFTLGAYFFGVATRSGVPTASAISVVRAVPDMTTGQSISYLGIFSPVRHDYTAAFAPELLVSNTSENGGGSGPLNILHTENGIELHSFMVDVGGLRPLLLEQTVTTPKLRASYRREGKMIHLDVENLDTTVLEDCTIIMSEGLQKLGDLQPGERRQFTIDPTGTFGELQLRQDGMINRSAAINVLTSWGFAISLPPKADGSPSRPMITLAAWSPKPQVAFTLDGKPTPVQGSTLYSWPLTEVLK